MLTRIITATLLLSMSVLLYWYANAAVINIFVAFCMIKALYEAYNILGINGVLVRLAYTVGFISIGAALYSFHNEIISLSILLSSLVWWLYCSYILLSQRVNNFTRLSRAVKISLPIVWLLPAWYVVILLWGENKAILALCCVMIWLSDSAAYFIGKYFGARPLLPKVSPKKTWEGLLAGIITPFLCYLAVYYLKPIGYMLQYNLAYQLAALLLILSFGVIGDLTESLFKRSSGYKDSGNILPGHGGILDRIDSLLAALPILIIGLIIGAKFIG